jgi:hypothetical protein
MRARITSTNNHTVTTPKLRYTRGHDECESGIEWIPKRDAGTRKAVRSAKEALRLSDHPVYGWNVDKSALCPRWQKCARC